MPTKLLIVPRKPSSRRPETRLVWQFMSYIGYALDGIEVRIVRKADKPPAGIASNAVLVTISTPAPIEQTVDIVEMMAHLLEGRLHNMDGSRFDMGAI